MKNSYFSKFIFAFILLLVTSSSSLFAQGVTSSAMNGTVTDENGDAMPNANVIAVHEPSGTQYGVSTMVNGRFNLLKLRPGGPYTVTVSFVGYTTQKEENVNLKLSQNLELQFVLTPEDIEITGVTVVAEKSSILSGSRTGATQNVTAEDIAVVPTINRQFQDFSKLSPQFSGNSSSAAGRNNRFNNIQIDGTQHNDLFGLGATGAPGGQVNTAPISLDAIEEFQVVIAPYDVRFGSFTGGGINAITRSGTNKFHGSVYGFGRNESLIGNAGFLDEDKEFPEFKNYQYGFRIGGPIIRNKLFFFVSGELVIRDQPFTNQSLQTGDVSGNTTSAERLQGVLRGYGYEPGGFGTVIAEQPSDKIFARLDWNISQNHTLSLRNNYVNARRDFLFNRNNTSRLAFETFNYGIKSETNSLAGQLNSTFGNNMSNELIVGFTTIRDRRAGLQSPLPEVVVDEGSLTMHVGPDRFSSANELDQDIFEITDNFTFITGDHAVTIGTHNEFFSFRNLFIRSFYGYYTYDSIDDLENNAAPSFFQRVFSRTDDPKQPAEFSVNQFGGYIQDEWTVAPNFKVTAGIRLDIPFLPDTPEENDSIPVYFKDYSTTTVPDGNLLFSPRIGFNWDVSENRSTQVRGGVGIFTGRIPYVWLSNGYGNTGTLYAEVRQAFGENVGFHADPFDQPDPGDPGTGDARLQSEVDLTDGDFKFPQVLRFNAAVDHQLPLGFVGTFEFLYSKSVNDIVYTKINLVDTTNRKIAEEEGRKLWDGTNSGNGNFFDVLEMTNTDEGYQYSLTFQLQKTSVRGFSVNTAYTYGVAKDVNSVLSSQARSQIRRNPIVDDPNSPPLGYSRFDPGHRVFASISFVHEFFDNAPTTISIFYNGQSGQRFSFTVDNDLNNDGFDNNDLFFIPGNDDDILLGRVTGGVYERADQSEYDALFSFIDNNDYLMDNKGKMSERNGARNPWRYEFDLKIIQDIPTFGFGHIQLTLDILNFMNLLDSRSGWVETTQFPNYEIVDWTRAFDPATDRPVYSFNNRSNNVPWDVNDLLSRWAMQFGVRWFL